MDREQLIEHYHTYFWIKEGLSLALHQLESRDPDDRQDAVKNIEKALDRASERYHALGKVLADGGGPRPPSRPSRKQVGDRPLGLQDSGAEIAPSCRSSATSSRAAQCSTIKPSAIRKIWMCFTE